MLRLLSLAGLHFQITGPHPRQFQIALASSKDAAECQASPVILHTLPIERLGADLVSQLLDLRLKRTAGYLSLNFLMEQVGECFGEKVDGWAQAERVWVEMDVDLLGKDGQVEDGEQIRKQADVALEIKTWAAQEFQLQSSTFAEQKKNV